MLRGSPAWFSRDLAIDLGTSSTRIYVRGKGIVASEPSVVAIRDVDPGRNEVLAVGSAADAMLGRVPTDVRAVRPLRDGAIADFDATYAMLRLIGKRGNVRREDYLVHLVQCAIVRRFMLTHIQSRAHDSFIFQRFDQS